MRTLKTTKKTVKPDIIVNCIGCKTSNDVYYNYVRAKARASKPITEEDLDIAENVAAMNVETPIIFVNEVFEYKPKKLPWYKRFWNKLRHPFSR